MLQRVVLPLAVIVIAVVGVAFSSHHHDVASVHKAKVAAAERAKLPACVTENAQLTISADEQRSLELVILGHLNTVPAGTSVDLQFSSYTSQQAVGSVEYAGAYGTYNFQTIQTGKSQGISSGNGTTDGGWKLTSFEPCQKIAS